MSSPHRHVERPATHSSLTAFIHPLIPPHPTHSLRPILPIPQSHHQRIPPCYSATKVPTLAMPPSLLIALASGGGNYLGLLRSGKGQNGGLGKVGRTKIRIHALPSSEKTRLLSDGQLGVQRRQIATFLLPGSRAGGPFTGGVPCDWHTHTGHCTHIMDGCGGDKKREAFQKNTPLIPPAPENDLSPPHVHTIGVGGGYKWVSPQPRPLIPLELI